MDGATTPAEQGEAERWGLAAMSQFSRFWANTASNRNYCFNGWRLIGLVAPIVIISYSLISSAIHPRSVTDTALDDGLRDRPVSHRVSAGRR
jgi:hypothetical protein